MNPTITAFRLEAAAIEQDARLGDLTDGEVESLAHAVIAAQILDRPAGAAIPRAFPSNAVDDRFGGMPLRDWFAGQALAGYCAAPDFAGPTDENLARASYAVADAMMAKRANLAAVALAERAKGGGA